MGWCGCEDNGGMRANFVCQISDGNGACAVAVTVARSGAGVGGVLLKTCCARSARDGARELVGAHVFRANANPLLRAHRHRDDDIFQLYRHASTRS